MPFFRTTFHSGTSQGVVNPARRSSPTSSRAAVRTSEPSATAGGYAADMMARWTIRPANLCGCREWLQSRWLPVMARVTLEWAIPAPVRDERPRGNDPMNDPQQEPQVRTPPIGSPPKLAFKVSETAVLLSVSDKTIRRLVARGLLRPSKALRHLLIPRSEIERFLNETR